MLLLFQSAVMTAAVGRRCCIIAPIPNARRAGARKSGVRTLQADVPSQIGDFLLEPHDPIRHRSHHAAKLLELAPLHIDAELAAAVSPVRRAAVSHESRW